MKRYIRAATQYSDSTTISHGNKRFFVHYDPMDQFGGIYAQISEIHPYDDAEYAWAKIDGLVAYFYQNGKVIDKMHLASYEEEDWETPAEYFDDVLDSVAVELIHINKDVKPIMVHN